MNDEKLLNLAGGKVLYDDLRDRIKETAAEISQATAGAVKFNTEQNLTSAQKETARENIAAAGAEQMDAELSDLWDETNAINEILTKYNCVELLKYKNYTSGTADGVSFQWTDSNTCVVSGTATAAYAHWRMHYISHAATDEQWSKVKLVPGGTYFLHFNSPSKKVNIEIEYDITQSGGSYDQQVYTTGDTLFTIPMSCYAVAISLAVPLESGAVNETVEYGVYSAPSNIELYKKVGGVTDVQVNGTSVVTDGVANVPIGGLEIVGVMGYKASRGLAAEEGGLLRIQYADSSTIKAGADSFRPIVPTYLPNAIYFGLAKLAGEDMKNMSGITLGVYPEAQKSAISTMLNSPVSVAGTTPTITALSGIQYVCGEVATLDITLPASGIVDVVFESGSTPTVLTVTPPTGMTVEWANGFDSTALEADTLYELNIRMVGTKCLGVAGQWS